MNTNNLSTIAPKYQEIGEIISVSEASDSSRLRPCFLSRHIEYNIISRIGSFLDERYSGHRDDRRTGKETKTKLIFAERVDSIQVQNRFSAPTTTHSCFFTYVS